MKTYNKKCLYCNISFIVDRNNRKKLYCSRECKLFFSAEKRKQSVKTRLLLNKKVCSVCKEEKTLSEFSGLSHAYCKPCQATWRRMKRKASYGKEAAQVLERKGKDYKSYLQANIASIKARAKKKQLPYNITSDYLISLAEKQNFLCALTGQTLTFIVGEGTVNTNASVDRIIPSLGYVESNVQLVSLKANIIKHSLTLPELYELCSQILTRSADTINRM